MRGPTNPVDRVTLGGAVYLVERIPPRPVGHYDDGRVAWSMPKTVIWEHVTGPTGSFLQEVVHYPLVRLVMDAAEDVQEPEPAPGIKPATPANGGRSGRHATYTVEMLTEVLEQGAAEGWARNDGEGWLVGIKRDDLAARLAPESTDQLSALKRVRRDAPYSVEFVRQRRT